MKHKQVTFCNKDHFNLEPRFFVPLDQHTRIELAQKVLFEIRFTAHA